MMARMAAICATLAAPAWAQMPDLNEPAVAEALAPARALCIEAGEPGGPKPELIFEPGAFTWLDIDGDFEPNDLVIDFNHIFCTASFSLWHGSGGSYITLILNGDTAATWSGGGWQMVEFRGVRTILIGRHGSWCDSAGARACILAVTGDQDGFATVGDTGPVSWK